jgi:dipeptidyl aminopeptidase/acylaminoacyl peptidase
MVLDANGSRELTPAGKDVYDSAPDWSPDGRALAFARFTTRDERYRSSIVVRDLAGGTERLLVTQRLFPRFGSVGEPDWSPDGTTIAYTYSELDRRHYFRPAVRTIPAGGGTARTLIPRAQSPDWSPDGSRLAFASVRDRNGDRCGSDECWYAGELYTAAADGSGETRLTRNEGDDTDPQWSPDGSRILFTSDRNLPESDAAEVYSIAADRSCLTWLTNGTPASASATWRPGSGVRYDPGDRDPASRPALLATPALRRVRGGLWLGATYRGLLLSRVERDFLAYDDCSLFQGCREPITIGSEPACRPVAFRGSNQFRYLRIRGALVAYYSPEAVVRVISGHAVTSIQLGSGNRLGAVRRVIRSLLPYRAARSARLAPPRIPRALEPKGRFRRALRSFGPLRYSRC